MRWSPRKLECSCNLFEPHLACDLLFMRTRLQLSCGLGRGIQRSSIPHQSQSQRQRLLRSSLPAADLTAEMETMAQRHVSMDDSIHLPNFPHMAWVDPSALPAIVVIPSLRARFECITSSLITLSSPSASPIHIVSHDDDA